jgi:peptidoglycan-associated lipoprotein
MVQRTLAIPVISCLFAAALVGCADDSKPPEPPQVSAVVPPADSRPSAENRAAVLQGGLTGAGIADRVFFAYDSSLLGLDATRVLQAQALWLKGKPAAMLTVEGHADERGTREYNLALGDRRAGAVRDYLVAQGVPSGRIRTLSYGKERPVVVGHDESAWAQNRRGVSVVQ